MSVSYLKFVLTFASVVGTLCDHVSFETLIKEFKSLKESQAKYDHRIDALEQARCDDRINALEQRNDELMRELERIGKVNQDLLEMLTLGQASGGIAQITKSNETDRARNGMKNQGHSTVLGTTSRGRRQGIGNVAFTAAVGVVDLDNLGVHHTVVFDRVITNLGGAYHPQTGIFTAPLHGAYVFTLTIMVNGLHSEYLEIVKDGVVVNDILADASADHSYSSTTKQWILELNKNSEVWVRTKSVYGQGVHGNMHTQLNGFLLYEIE